MLALLFESYCRQSHHFRCSSEVLIATMVASAGPSLRSLLQSLFFLLAVLAPQTVIHAYDSSSMQFHPDGRVLQIEYSKDAVKKGGPISAYRCNDGVVIIAVRKAPVSKFLVNPLQKVFQIDRGIMIAATGLLFDANVIVDVAKRISLQHRSIYSDDIPVESLSEELSEIMHKQVIQLDPLHSSIRSVLKNSSLAYYCNTACI